MSIFPTGTVTFLFTDIEGSTQLWEQHPDAMKAALARHDVLLRQAVESHNGYVVKTTGDGLHAAFAVALDALEACLAAQRAIQRMKDDPSASSFDIKVRMGLHTGATEERDGDYFGPGVNRAARVMAAGHGGQILLSRATAELMQDRLPQGVSLRDLGTHRLKGLNRPERIFTSGRG